MNAYIFAQRLWRHVPAGIKVFIRGAHALDSLKTMAHQRLKVFDKHNAIYNDSYFEGIERYAQASVRCMVKTLVDLEGVHSLYDVGCGTGALMLEAKKMGIDVKGCDLSEASIQICRRKGLAVEQVDLESDDVTCPTVNDLACCLEVAEHLPGNCADRLVKSLCKLSSRVVFSAAPPGQADVEHHDHVNEQPKEYWIEKFAQNGFDYCEAQTRGIADAWEKGGVAFFYHRNLMIFKKGPGLSRDPTAGKDGARASQ